MSDPYGPPPEEGPVDKTGRPDISRGPQYLNHDLKEQKSAKPLTPPDSITSPKRPWSKGNYNFGILVYEGEPRPATSVGFTSDDAFLELYGITGPVTIEYKRNFEDDKWKTFKTVDGSTGEVLSVRALNGVYRVTNGNNLSADAEVIIRAR